MKFMQSIRIASLVTICAVSANLALAQTPATDITENSALQQETSSGPIAVNFHFKKDAGGGNLTINPDGTYLFSGQYKSKMKNKDFDLVFGLKSSLGGVVLFQFVGDATNGVQWSKQGQEAILKDDFSSFAKHAYYWEYHFSETAAGKKAAYEAREKKKAELKKEEEEAKKRKDEIAAKKKKEELEQEQKQEQAQAQAAAQQKSNGGGGGSSVWSTVGDVAGAIGGALLALF
jgi:hypothetical protein